MTLPYIKGLSEAVRQILAPLAIKVVFSLLSTLRKMLVHSKDPVPSDQCKGVVYSIPCDACPKVYIGQTGGSLKHWLAEYSRSLRNGDVAASALAEHTLATGLSVDLTKAQVRLASQPLFPERKSRSGKTLYQSCVLWVELTHTRTT